MTHCVKATRFFKIRRSSCEWIISTLMSSDDYLILESVKTFKYELKQRVQIVWAGWCDEDIWIAEKRSTTQSQQVIYVSINSSQEVNITRNIILFITLYYIPKCDGSSYSQSQCSRFASTAGSRKSYSAPQGLLWNSLNEFQHCFGLKT